MGIAGITLSTSFVTLFNAVVLGLLIHKKIKLAYKELFMNFIKMFVAGSLTFIMCVIVSNWFNTFELPKYIFETTKILTISVLCFIAYTMLNLLFKMDYAKELVKRLKR